MVVSWKAERQNAKEWGGAVGQSNQVLRRRKKRAIRQTNQIQASLHGRCGGFERHEPGTEFLHEIPGGNIARLIYTVKRKGAGGIARRKVPARKRPAIARL